MTTVNEYLAIYESKSTLKTYKAALKKYFALFDPDREPEKPTKKTLDELVELYFKQERDIKLDVQELRARFTEGLEYYVLRVDEGRKEFAYRGMVEFMPGDVCWKGIDAPNYMVIHCIWVVGRHKGKGYGSMLVDKAVSSAQTKGMDGVTVITVAKGGWTPKKGLFEKKEFKKIDSQGIYELYALKLREGASNPRFLDLKDYIGARAQI